MNDFAMVRSAEDVQSAGNADGQSGSVREILISDLVRANDVSVRLENCISLAMGDRGLPLKTIGDYLDAGPAAQPILLRGVRNFGRKTARELQALIDDACANGLSPPPPDDTQHAADAKDERDRLLAHFEHFQGRSLTAGEFVSARLLNVLQLMDISERPVIEILDQSPHFGWQMMRIQNCGRKSVKEFNELCERFVGRTLTGAGFSPTEVARGVALIFRKPAPPVANEHALDSATNGVPELQPSAFLVPEHRTLAERLDWLMTELGERPADILRRRYGIGYPADATLEDVGLIYGVTRERIRQIEAKSLKKLRIRMRRAPFDDLMAGNAPQEWQAVSENGFFLRESQLYEKRRRLSPHMALALDVLEMPLRKWLDDIAVRQPYGWCGSDVTPGRLEQVAKALSAATESLPLPRAVPDLGVAASEAEVEAACELILGRGIRGGYLVPPRVGTRLARALGLHALFSRVANPKPVQEVLVTYHRCFPHDLCSARDAEIVMEAAPHLFLEIEEDSWIAVGPGGRVPKPAADLAQRESLLEDPGTIAHALQATLSRLGPTRLCDLLEMAHEILPPDRSINSIGPVLLTRRELFVRVLPGVYSLPEHLPGEGGQTASILGMLLNEQQARLFALARYAGEPVDLFPYWGSASEYELCRWARHSADRATFCSLMAIADVDAWPIPTFEREEWKLCKQRDGRFELGSALRRHTAYCRPDLVSVVTALVYTLAEGSLNWMAANRLTGRKLDSHGGAGLLIVLLQLGALREPRENGFRWQMPHPVAPAARELRDLLLNELSLTGDLSWESEIGGNLAARASAPAAPGTWVDSVSVAALFEGTPAAGPVEAEEGDPVDLLMAAHRRLKDAERRRTTLQWLLEE